MVDRQLVMVSTNLTNESERDLCHLWGCLLAAEPRSGFHEGDPPLKLCSGFYMWFHEDDPLAELRSGFPAPLAKLRSGFHEGDLLDKPCSGIHDRLSKFLSGSHALAFLFLEGDPMSEFLSGSHALAFLFPEGDLLSKFLSGFHALLAKPHSGFHEGDQISGLINIAA